MDYDANSEKSGAQRSEVYERIPWEHLEKQANDRQWLYVGVVGAIALGVLAYSFVKNQPAQPQAMTGSAITMEAELPPPPTDVTEVSEPVSSPVVVAEADLYAVDPERLAATAAAHAEWFAVEYFSIDGSEISTETLRNLLPAGVPLPEAPQDTQVFVDWVGTRQISRVDELEYEIDVLVRSLVSTETAGFVRQPVRLLRVRIQFGSDGEPQLSMAPTVMEAPPTPASRIDLTQVPPEVAARATPGSSVVGGVPLREGGWRLVVMAVGVDGVTRPQMLDVP